MRMNWPDLVLGLVLVLFAVACAWNLIGAVRYRAILSQRKMLLFQRDDVGLREDPIRFWILVVRNAMGIAMPCALLVLMFVWR